MKKNKILLGAAVGIFTFAGVTMAAVFSDIAGHWAEDDLLWAVENGLLRGDDLPAGEDKTLRPNDPVTRAELATILRRYNSQFEPTEMADNIDFQATVNGITWVGREILVNEEDTIYEVVKVDEFGSETVIYKVEFGHFGGNVEWDFSNEGKDLMIEIKYYGLHGFVSTQLAFENNEETIRSHHEVYLGYEEDLSFEWSNSNQHDVRLITSDLCEGSVPDTEDFAAPQVELLGVEISSEEGVQTFELDEPELIKCPAVDGLFAAPGPQNITTHPTGISFDLPNGDQAWISTEGGPEALEVQFTGTWKSANM